MKLGLALLLQLAATAAAAPPAAPEAAGSGIDVYVDADGGSDTAGDGTEASPFRTIGKGQRLARQHLAGPPLAGNVTVHLAAGDYYLPNGLAFTAADSGRDGFSVVYSGAGGAATRLRGGVPLSGWARASAPNATAGSLWSTNVTAALHAANVSKRRFFGLISGGAPATLARIPKAGSGYLDELGCSSKGLTVTCPAGVLPPALPDQVADAGLYANLGSDWFTDLRQVLSAKPNRKDGSMSVNFEPGAAGVGPRVYLQGAKSLISEPGEWALDSGAGTLYYYPHPDELAAMENGSLSVFATTATVVLDIRGAGFDSASLAHDIVFTGIGVQGSDFGPSFNSDASYDSDTSPCKRSITQTEAYKELHNQGMVRVENASRVAVVDSWLLDAGYSGFWLEGWAQNVTIARNVVTRAGVMGVYLNGPLPGDTHWGKWNSPAEAYVNKGHLVEDNVFYDYGQRVGHGSAVWFFQAGDSKVLHNHIQEGPRDSIGVYSCRFGGGTEAGMHSAYNKTLDFWSALDVLTTRNIEVAYNRIRLVVRDTADAGALEYWGTGANNVAHHNCFSDMDPGILDGSWMNFLFQDDAAHFLNFSSNIMFHVAGQGSEEAGMIKSIGSVFENSIIADSVLSHAFNSQPYIEPAGNMIFARNIFANITAPPYTIGATGHATAASTVASTTVDSADPALAGFTEIAGALSLGHQLDGGPSFRCGSESNVTACAEILAKRCNTVKACQSFALDWLPAKKQFWSELYSIRGGESRNAAWSYWYRKGGQPVPPPPPGPPPGPGPSPRKSPVDYSIGSLSKQTIATSAALMRGVTGQAYGFTNTTSPAASDPVVRLWDFNTFFGVEGHSIKQIASQGFDLNASEADPQFARGSGDEAYWNKSCSDYAVAAGSHATTVLGFRPIDMAPGFGPRAAVVAPAQVSVALRVNGVQRKIQAERYQRMRGLWREGSLGIGVGAAKKGLSYAFAPTAWARYDGITLNCSAPCMLRMRLATRSPTGTVVRVSIGAPAEDDAAALATVHVGASSTNWSVASAAVRAPLVGITDATLFLRINGTARIDWFRFDGGSDAFEAQ